MHERPPNDIDMFEVMEAQIFNLFTLRLAVFIIVPNLWEKCTECPLYNLNMLKVKITDVHSTYTLGPKFPFALVYDGPFLVRARFTVKWPTNDFDMFEMKSAHVHISYPET